MKLRAFTIPGAVFALAALGAPQQLRALDITLAAPNCTATGFGNALASVDGSGSGTLRFNCGAVTIPITVYKQIANTVTIDGGGIVTLDGGGASPLFQFYASSKVTLRGLTLTRGVMGAAHPLENFGMLTLDRVHVLNNVSSDSALANNGTLVVLNSAFTGNKATGANKDGGAISHQGAFMRISGSTFAGNQAARHGGAIHSQAAMMVRNSTFNGNVTSTGGGGAIYQEGSGASVLDHVTLVGNSAGCNYGGGIYNDGGGSATLEVRRSLLANNTGFDCDGVLISGGYSLASDTHCGGAFTQTGDAVGQSLPMGTLASNGGITQTMLPTSGNPAINRIPRSACAIPTDQRGAIRPFGAQCDSGAVEVGATVNNDSIFWDGFE